MRSQSADARDWDVYYHGVDPVSGFVLAGGRSSRMGQDKAFLQLGDRTLLARALDLANTATGNVRIVGSVQKFAAFAPVIEDVFPGQGPLAGIHAALAATDTELNLIIAVDLPFLRPTLLHYLLALARESAATVVIPRTSGGLQPLCGVYRTDFAEIAERSLCEGKGRIDRLFLETHTRIVEPEELEQNGFEEQMFRNLNTEEDWQEAKQKMAAG